MIRLGVRVARGQAELVLAELLELAPSGVEEIDDGGAVIEYAVYGPAGEVPTLPDVRAAAGEALVEVRTTEVADDWSERWRAFHRPVLVPPPAGARGIPALHVRPPWEAEAEASAPAGTDVAEIVIDPAQAFGTGAHATTRMCLELMLELAARGLAGGPLVDVGCGSGVLAIAGARLGFSPIVGLDHEQESVVATRDNARVNGVLVEARRFDLRRERLPSLRVPDAPLTIVANLLRPLLLELAGSLVEVPSQLLASGLLAPEVDEVVAAFAQRCGLAERERRQSGEWAAVWLSAADGRPAS